MAALYQRGGYRLLLRNFRHIGCEIDLLVSKGSELIVVEVKKRRAFPQAARDIEALLPKRKMQAIHRGINQILKTISLPDWQTLRFDLVVVNWENKARAYKNISLE